MSDLLYLVPYDFTSISENAVDHALHIARKSGSPATIMLLHIVKSDNDVNPARAKLQNVMDKLHLAPTDPEVDGRVVVGNIFEDIGKMAGFANARLIVMGTHGATGMQKILGSRALRVITNSHIPFVVVQESGPHGPYEDIVLPLNLEKESLRVLRLAEDLAKRYGSKIHLVGPKENDEWLAKKIKANMQVSRKHLAAQGIEFTVNILDGDKPFHEQVMDFGRKIGVSLYALAYVQENLLPFFDRFAQSLITNPEQLPVLIVNPTQVYETTGGFLRT